MILFAKGREREREREKKKRNIQYRKAAALSRLECLLSLLFPLILDHFLESCESGGILRIMHVGCIILGPLHRCQDPKQQDKKISDPALVLLQLSSTANEIHPFPHTKRKMTKSQASYVSTKGVLGSLLPHSSC